MNYSYHIGEIVESFDSYSGQWRRARVVALRPYLGRPGYDVMWLQSPYSDRERIEHDLPTPSSGGWQYDATMRKVGA